MMTWKEQAEIYQAERNGIRAQLATVQSERDKLKARVVELENALSRAAEFVGDRLNTCPIDSDSWIPPFECSEVCNDYGRGDTAEKCWWDYFMRGSK